MGVSKERMFALGGNVTIHIGEFQGSAYVERHLEVLARSLVGYLMRSTLRGSLDFYCQEITDTKTPEDTPCHPREEIPGGRVLLIDIGKVRVIGILLRVTAAKAALPPKNDTRPHGLTVPEVESTPGLMLAFLEDVARRLEGDERTISAKNIAEIGKQHFKLPKKPATSGWNVRLQTLIRRSWIRTHSGSGHRIRYALGTRGVAELARAHPHPARG